MVILQRIMYYCCICVIIQYELVCLVTTNHRPIPFNLYVICNLYLTNVTAIQPPRRKNQRLDGLIWIHGLISAIYLMAFFFLGSICIIAAPKSFIRHSFLLNVMWPMVMVFTHRHPFLFFCLLHFFFLQYNHNTGRSTIIISRKNPPTERPCATYTEMPPDPG